MKLLGRKKETEAPPDGDDVEVSAEPGSSAKSTAPSTAPKGRPTPKRDATKRRGPIAPAPRTAGEARRRRKELRTKLSREERREEKMQRRTDMADRRERMMAGEEAYLLPRDKGPVRRYIRDIVDARRNVLGLFMPAALGLIFVMLAAPLVVQPYISPAMLVLVAVMGIDGFFLGRKVNRLVDAKFPNHTEGRWKLGWYAAGRASQLRRMRTPRPLVKRGDSVD